MFNLWSNTSVCKIFSILAASVKNPFPLWNDTSPSLILHTMSAREMGYRVWKDHLKPVMMVVKLKQPGQQPTQKHKKIKSEEDLFSSQPGLSTLPMAELRIFPKKDTLHDSECLEQLWKQMEQRQILVPSLMLRWGPPLTGELEC